MSTPLDASSIPPPGTQKRRSQRIAARQTVHGGGREDGDNQGGVAGEDSAVERGTKRPAPEPEPELEPEPEAAPAARGIVIVVETPAPDRIRRVRFKLDPLHDLTDSIENLSISKRPKQPILPTNLEVLSSAMQFTSVRATLEYALLYANDEETKKTFLKHFLWNALECVDREEQDVLCARILKGWGQIQTLVEEQGREPGALLLAYEDRPTCHFMTDSCSFGIDILSAPGSALRREFAPDNSVRRSGGQQTAKGTPSDIRMWAYMATSACSQIMQIVSDVVHMETCPLVTAALHGLSMSMETGASGEAADVLNAIGPHPHTRLALSIAEAGVINDFLHVTESISLAHYELPAMGEMDAKSVYSKLKLPVALKGEEQKDAQVPPFVTRMLHLIAEDAGSLKPTFFLYDWIAKLTMGETASKDTLLRSACADSSVVGVVRHTLGSAEAEIDLKTRGGNLHMFFSTLVGGNAPRKPRCVRTFTDIIVLPAECNLGDNNSWLLPPLHRFGGFESAIRGSTRPAFVVRHPGDLEHIPCPVHEHDMRDHIIDNTKIAMTWLQSWYKLNKDSTWRIPGPDITQCGDPFEWMCTVPGCDVSKVVGHNEIQGVKRAVLKTHARLPFVSFILAWLVHQMTLLGDSPDLESSIATDIAHIVEYTIGYSPDFLAAAVYLGLVGKENAPSSSPFRISCLRFEGVPPMSFNASLRVYALVLCGALVVRWKLGKTPPVSIAQCSRNGRQQVLIDVDTPSLDQLAPEAFNELFNSCLQVQKDWHIFAHSSADEPTSDQACAVLAADNHAWGRYNEAVFGRTPVTEQIPVFPSKMIDQMRRLSTILTNSYSAYSPHRVNVIARDVAIGLLPLVADDSSISSDLSSNAEFVNDGGTSDTNSDDSKDADQPPPSTTQKHINMIHGARSITRYEVLNGFVCRRTGPVSENLRKSTKDNIHTLVTGIATSIDEILGSDSSKSLLSKLDRTFNCTAFNGASDISELVKHKHPGLHSTFVILKEVLRSIPRDISNQGGCIVDGTVEYKNLLTLTKNECTLGLRVDKVVHAWYTQCIEHGSAFDAAFRLLIDACIPLLPVALPDAGTNLFPLGNLWRSVPLTLSAEHVTRHSTDFDFLRHLRDGDPIGVLNRVAQIAALKRDSAIQLYVHLLAYASVVTTLLHATPDQLCTFFNTVILPIHDTQSPMARSSTASMTPEERQGVYEKSNFFNTFVETAVNKRAIKLRIYRLVAEFETEFLSQTLGSAFSTLPRYIEKTRTPFNPRPPASPLDFAMHTMGINRAVHSARLRVLGDDLGSMASPVYTPGGDDKYVTASSSLGPPSYHVRWSSVSQTSQFPTLDPFRAITSMSDLRDQVSMYRRRVMKTIFESNDIVVATGDNTLDAVYNDAMTAKFNTETMRAVRHLVRYESFRHTDDSFEKHCIILSSWFRRILATYAVS